MVMGKLVLMSLSPQQLIEAMSFRKKILNKHLICLMLMVMGLLRPRNFKQLLQMSLILGLVT